MNINLTLIGQTIVFAIFVWICMKYIWPPIMAAMIERQQKIEEGLLAAEKGIAVEKDSKKQADELIKQSRNKAGEIIANANKKASQTIEDAKNLAKVEADKIKAQALADIDHERSLVAMELKTKLSELVIKGVNKVLSKEVDEKIHKNMLDKLITTL